jgi:hypothetical protein
VRAAAQQGAAAAARGGVCEAISISPIKKMGKKFESNFILDTSKASDVHLAFCK